MYTLTTQPDEDAAIAADLAYLKYKQTYAHNYALALAGQINANLAVVNEAHSSDPYRDNIGDIE